MSYKFMLHDPQRIDNLHEMDGHIEIAAHLARAVWLILNDPNLDLSDPRNHGAVCELSGIASDHASAARFCLFKSSKIVNDRDYQDIEIAENDV